MVSPVFAIGSAVPSNLGIFAYSARLSLLELPVSNAGSILTLTLVVVSVRGSLDFRSISGNNSEDNNGFIYAIV